jgi:hypothetical protein
VFWRCSLELAVALNGANTMNDGVDVYCYICFAMPGEMCRSKYTPTQIPELQHKPIDGTPEVSAARVRYECGQCGHTEESFVKTRSGSSRPPAVKALRYVLTARARPPAEAPAPLGTRRYRRYWRSARRAIYKFMKFWNEAPDVRGQDAICADQALAPVSAGRGRFIIKLVACPPCALAK